ncbi:MAG: preprotein translocase subunit SecA [Zetaproteobacteria bacterium]|nr:preprotein translocase subunit SecA [Zetaproteobacteria bacterium]
MKILTKIFGTRNDKILKGIQPLVEQINALESSLEILSDEQLKAKTVEFRQRHQKGESLDSLLPEAFATCREASKRTLKQRHYDVQLIGGIVLHQGKIAEMKTGEGKTLTATLPCYLHGLSGHGAHVVTVNDYLARRDAEWMGEVYRFLGLTVGSITHGMNEQERQAAYACDITYGTNNEFGFDYLRDNMKTDPQMLVQRELNFAIVDEVDSILIDEARTPLIISGPAETNIGIYGIVNAAIPGLQKDSDYMVDEKARSVALSEDGISKLEKRLKIDNLYDPQHIEFLHHCQQALKAHVLFRKDVDYVVRNNEIVIVDEFTGRLMPGRRYSDGLHGALEAKEQVAVQKETQTLATITFQNFFRLYQTLSGMTGTADTEAVEFKKVYNLEVVVVPTHRTLTRVDEEDVVYRTMREKFNAIADDIMEAQKRGQPVLVGTVSVEKSELLSMLLNKRGVEHSILNAKNHAKEAEIITNAGKKSRVTISTNMAGRGTDIKVDEECLELGGLYVIGTERHESRRIDNQLRGRSGRQGDKGRSKFFLSLEDDFMRIFASDRLSALMSKIGMEEGEAIVSPMLTRTVEKAQKRVEEQNFSSRKHVLEYDDVMSQQRQVIYGKRREALFGRYQVDFVEPTLHSIILGVAGSLSPEAQDTEAWDLPRVTDTLEKQVNISATLTDLNPESCDADTIATTVTTQALQAYQEKLSKIPEQLAPKLENYIYLQILDQTWKEHLLSMDSLKDSVSLRGYGQRDPLQEYNKEAFQLFATMMERVEYDATLALLHMPEPKGEFIAPESAEGNEMMGEEEERLAAYLSPQQKPNSPTDNLIYRGSQVAQQLEEQPSTPTAQTIRRDGEKVGRNDSCPCGSGKKYKKCCGRAGTPPANFRN